MHTHSLFQLSIPLLSLPLLISRYLFRARSALNPNSSHNRKNKKSRHDHHHHHHKERNRTCLNEDEEVTTPWLAHTRRHTNHRNATKMLLPPLSVSSSMPCAPLSVSTNNRAGDINDHGRATTMMMMIWTTKYAKLRLLSPSTTRLSSEEKFTSHCIQPSQAAYGVASEKRIRIAKTHPQ